MHKSCEREDQEDRKPEQDVQLKDKRLTGNLCRHVWSEGQNTLRPVRQCDH